MQELKISNTTLHTIQILGDFIEAIIKYKI